MKNIITQRFLVILLILMSSKNTAQKIISNGADDSNEVYIAVSIEADFSGGPYKLRSFVSKNFKIPSKAVRNKVQGEILVQFAVEKDGSLSDIKALSNLGFGIEEESVRVFKTSPIWKPASMNGKHYKSIKVFRMYINTTNKKEERIYFDKQIQKI